MIAAQKKLNNTGLGCLYWFIVFAGVIIFFSFSPSQKRYKAEFTLQEWDEIILCLQQSNAPSVQTNKLINGITSQINPVLQFEQKQLQDSLNKVKPPKQN